MADETNPPDAADPVPKPARERPRIADGPGLDPLREMRAYGRSGRHDPDSDEGMAWLEGYNAGVTGQQGELRRLSRKAETAEKTAADFRNLMLFIVGLLIGVMLATAPNHRGEPS